jgi:hypothetical protein
MTPRSLLTAVLALALFAGSPRAAFASQNFPDEVKKQWRLPGAAPDCIVCHQSEAGGEGTATKPFARSLQRDGLIEDDLGSLDQALATDKAQNTDSDGDGIPDFDELQMGLDPNDGPGAFGELPVPETGCTLGTPKRGQHGGVATWLFSLAAALLIVRTRRRDARISAWFSRG